MQVPIKVQDFNNIVWMQFTMEWDPTVYRFEKLSNLELEFVTNLGMVSDGKLTISQNIEDFNGLTLADDVIISRIESTTLDEARDPNLKITTGVTPALAFNTSLEPM